MHRQIRQLKNAKQESCRSFSTRCIFFVPPSDQQLYYSSYYLLYYYYLYIIYIYKRSNKRRGNSLVRRVVRRVVRRGVRSEGGFGPASQFSSKSNQFENPPNFLDTLIPMRIFGRVPFFNLFFEVRKSGNLILSFSLIFLAI